MENYHNTTEEEGNDLAELKQRATGQDEKLLDWFQDNPDKEVTAEDLWINLFDAASVPITSIRRSLNTLRDKFGEIKNILDPKTLKKKKIKGALYGRKIFVWKFKQPIIGSQLELFPGTLDQLNDIKI